MKKLFAVVMCIALILTAVPHMAFASVNNASQIVGAGGSSSTPDGKINISKTIAPTDDENYFDITLTATQEMPSTDIVMVMDVSNTMNTNDRIGKAKNAAIAFLEDYNKIVETGKVRRIGMVKFNSHAEKVFDLGEVRSNIDIFKLKIDDVKAPAGTWRFTNIEAGLKLASNMLKNSTADQKYIILITDGFPTTYIEKGADSTDKIYGYDTETIPSVSAPKQQTDGLFYDFVKKMFCSGTSYSDTAAIKARTLAEQLKLNGMNIYTIGIDISNESQTIQKYIDQGNTYGISIVERTGTTYEVGSVNDSTAYVNWLGKTVSGGDDLEKAGVTNAFSRGDTAEQLNGAFDKVLGYIKGSSPMTVSDPMGNDVEFLGFYNKDGKLAGNKLSGSHTANAENAAEYNNGITWNVTGSGYTDTTVNGKTIRSYSVTYRVRLMSEASDFVADKIYNANETTELTYIVTDEKDTDVQKTIEYKIPEIKGYLGSLSFKKVDGDTNTGLGGAQFLLEHNSDCSVCDGKVVISSISATSANDGIVSFSKIPSGHEYTLTETKAPLGYIENNNEYAVTVSYGVTTLDGNGITESTKIDNKAMTPAVLNLKGAKSLTGGDKTDADIKAGQFTFNISCDKANGVNGISSPVSVKQGGEIDFGEMKFTLPGEYTFTISENNANAAGYAYDSSSFTVKVEINVDAAGKNLVVSNVTYSKNGAVADGISFSNSYTAPAPVTAEISGTKTLKENGSDKEIKENSFFITVAPHADNSNGVSSIKTTKVPVNTDGTFAFETLTFSKAGTYAFDVTEENTGAAGYIYDNNIYTVEFTVTLFESDNTLRITDETVTVNGESANSIIFNNVYETPKPVELPVPGVTTLTGGGPVNEKTNDDITEGFFSYVVTGGDQEGVTDVPDGVDSLQGGKLDFGTWKFDRTGTYEFTITENTPPAGYTDLTGKVDMTVVVTLNEDTNTLETQVAYSSGDIIKIDNLYTAPAPIEDSIDGAKTLKENGNDKEIKENRFFAVIAPHADNSNGVSSIKTTKVPVNTDGTFAFETLTFSKAGTYSFDVTEENMGAAGYTYDNGVYTVEFTVALDESDNTLYIAEKTVTLDGIAADEIVFNNIYETPKPVELPVPGVTTLTGGGPVNEKTNDDITEGFFSYVVTGGDQEGVTDVPDGVDSLQGGKLDFGTWKFDRTGTYEFTITENTPLAGYTDLTGKVDMTVVVTLNEDTNTLETQVTYSSGDIIKIDNLYTAPAPIDVTLDGKKNLGGQKDNSQIEEGDFTFTVETDPANAAECYVPFEKDASVKAGGAVDFGKATFSKDGVYKFIIKENDLGVIGYTYDKSTYQVIVTVTLDKATNTLSATTDLTEDGAEAEKIVFDNDYTPLPASVVVTASKDVKGITLRDNEFKFVLTALDENNPMPEGANGKTIEKTVMGEGTVKFGTIIFTQPGTYSYTISETKGDNLLYIYDKSVYNVTYTVTDVDGILKVKSDMTFDGESVDSAVFTNISLFVPIIPIIPIVPIIPIIPVIPDGDIPEIDIPDIDISDWEIPGFSKPDKPSEDSGASDGESTEIPSTGNGRNAVAFALMGASAAVIIAATLKKKKEEE